MHRMPLCLLYMVIFRLVKDAAFRVCKGVVKPLMVSRVFMRAVLWYFLLVYFDGCGHCEVYAGFPESISVP